MYPGPPQPEDESGRRQLTLRHTRTLKMAEDVLAVACSPDGKMLALSLLDATIKARVP